jgi:hypothetical protein
MFWASWKAAADSIPWMATNTARTRSRRVTAVYKTEGQSEHEAERRA